jgi:hypothetical protein
MSDSTEHSVSEKPAPDASVEASTPLASFTNNYSDLFGLFPVFRNASRKCA